MFLVVWATTPFKATVVRILWQAAPATTPFKVALAKTDLMVTPEQIHLQVTQAQTL